MTGGRLYRELFKAVLAEVGAKKDIKTQKKQEGTYHPSKHTNEQCVRPMKQWNNTSL